MRRTGIHTASTTNTTEIIDKKGQICDNLSRDALKRDVWDDSFIKPKHPEVNLKKTKPV